MSDPTRSSSPGDGSSAYPESVVRLMEEFARLPGIGRRTAERLAFHILKSDKESALRFARAVQDVKTKVRSCSICFNFTEESPCSICRDARRDHSIILVVEEPKDVIALEQTAMYRGGYHVLLGRLSPLEGVGPDDLTTASLLARIDDPETNAQHAHVKEVIFGMSPNLEGDGTTMYLANELNRRGVRMTRLARGLPSGSQIEYASKAVLADAILGRQHVEGESPS